MNWIDRLMRRINERRYLECELHYMEKTRMKRAAEHTIIFAEDTKEKIKSDREELELLSKEYTKRMGDIFKSNQNEINEALKRLEETDTAVILRAAEQVIASVDAAMRAPSDSEKVDNWVKASEALKKMKEIVE